MNFTSEQVDLIVQRVVAQLVPQAVAQTASVRTDPAEGTSSPLAVQIPDKVITQALLSAAVNGYRQVHINSKAILTPSARDYVKQQGIKIVRETAGAKSVSPIRWQVLVTKSNPQITAAVESLAEQGVALDLRLLGLPAEAAAQATSALCRGEAVQVVVFTDQPELVACLANRNDRVRAAAAANVAAVERVRISMQANLIAIDPASRHTYELKTLLKAFRPNT